MLNLGEFAFKFYKENNKWGAIDPDGNVIIEPQYNYLTDFIDGLAIFQKGDRWGLIDPDGNIVTKREFTETIGKIYLV